MVSYIDKEFLLKKVESRISQYVISDFEEDTLNNIIKAMRIMDRRWFVDNTAHAYLDSAQPLSVGQSISQPSTVARMLLLLRPQPDNRVLEVGAGSGWQSAILSYLSYPGTITTIDIVDELVDLAKKNLSIARQNTYQDSARMLDTINVTKANFFELSAPQEFDRIIVTAGIKEEDKGMIIDQASEILADNGIMICPYQLGPLMIIVKVEGELSVDYTIDEFAFVPLLRPKE
ncbi:MAG: protein-L-isoaspartate O-methyltransferase family protein [Nanobdellota archaeon]